MKEGKIEINLILIDLKSNPNFSHAYNIFLSVIPYENTKILQKSCHFETRNHIAPIFK